MTMQAIGYLNASNDIIDVSQWSIKNFVIAKEIVSSSCDKYFVRAISVNMVVDISKIIGTKNIHYSIPIAGGNREQKRFTNHLDIGVTYWCESPDEFKSAIEQAVKEVINGSMTMEQALDSVEDKKVAHALKLMLANTNNAMRMQKSVWIMQCIMNVMVFMMFVLSVIAMLR